MKITIVLALIAMTSAGPSLRSRAGMPVRTRSFDLALASPPTTTAQWSALGKAFHDAGRYRDAAAAYQRAMQLDASVAADAARNVARAYAALGNRRQERRWLELAATIPISNRSVRNIIPLRVE